MLEKKFKILCENFSKDKVLINHLWQEIKSTHTQTKRHYHTLQHLQHIYQEIQPEDLKIHFEFAIFYHDIIYDVRRNDNEEQSAILAKKRLRELNIDDSLQKKIFELIVATAKHETSTVGNTLFLDADLSILGSSPERYEQYIQNIRKEYAIYDDATYVEGRKKVLKMFLEKEKVYKSEYFYEKYENKARKNLKQELKKLCLIK